MRNGTEQQRKIIRHAIEEGGLDELPAVMRAVADTGALEHVRKIARNEADMGCAAIAHLPDSSHHQALRKLAEFAVHRNY
jgi:octaprenyl-diphosphate synthase